MTTADRASAGAGNRADPPIAAANVIAQNVRLIIVHGLLSRHRRSRKKLAILTAGNSGFFRGQLPDELARGSC
jgi:hypothetical protein